MWHIVKLNNRKEIKEKATGVQTLKKKKKNNELKTQEFLKIKTILISATVKRNG